MRKPGLIIIIVAVAAGAVAGDPDARRQSWLEGPRAHLLLAAERAEVGGLSDDAELEAFERLFWARRDPDLSTVESEAELEFEARVEAADEEFATADRRGALTDRGRTLILLGVPRRNVHMPIADYMAELYSSPLPRERSSNPEATVTMNGVTFNLAKGRAHVWAYGRDQIPAGLEFEASGEEVVFAFFDHEGTGDFVLQRGIRLAQAGQTLLEMAPVGLVLHPQLTAPPAPVPWPGARAASPEQLAVLDRDAQPWPDDAVALADRGVTGVGELPLWVLLLLPPESAAADTVAGRATDGAGAPLGTFQTSVAPTASALGTAYELSLPLATGATTLELVLLAGDEVVAARTFTLDPAEVGEGGVFLTRVFAGAEIDEARDAKAGDAFVFGGYHLLPRPEGRFAKSENLSLFFVVVSEEDEPPAASVRMRWVVGGSPAPSSPAQAVKLGQAGDGVWVWGTQLPLATLTAGTEYGLRVKVEIGDGAASRSTELPILIAN